MWIALIANSAWPSSCGANIAIVFDTSNSISNDEGDDMKSAAEDFVDQLAGTPSHVALTWFGGIYADDSGVGGVEFGWKSIDTPAKATAVKADITAFTEFADNEGNGATNWGKGFDVCGPLLLSPPAGGKGMVVLFLTDGSPTTYTGDPGNTGSVTNVGDINAGVVGANAAKGRRLVSSRSVWASPPTPVPSLRRGTTWRRFRE